MKETNSINQLGDPSSIQQQFPNYNLQVLCCRHWWLTNWEFYDLSFPYWRLYYNNEEGATIFHKNKAIFLEPKKIYLIAPNTSYSTQLFDHHVSRTRFNLVGDRIENQNQPQGSIAHLFIHFNLGNLYDGIKPEVFVFEADTLILSYLDAIMKHVHKDSTHFSFKINLIIRSLLNILLCEIPQKKWTELTDDIRIHKVVNYIEDNIGDELQNEVLAKVAMMATNSFTRIFTSKMGSSPQRYVKRKRIDMACILLHHTRSTIEVIAEQTGFADRYHFSRVFKSIVDISPAVYRRLN